MIRNSVVKIFLACLGSVLVSCGDSRISSAEITGRWVMREAGGNPVPSDLAVGLKIENDRLDAVDIASGGDSLLGGEREYVQQWRSLYLPPAEKSESLWMRIVDSSSDVLQLQGFPGWDNVVFEKVSEEEWEAMSASYAAAAAVPPVQGSGSGSPTAPTVAVDPIPGLWEKESAADTPFRAIVQLNKNQILAQYFGDGWVRDYIGGEKPCSYLKADAKLAIDCETKKDSLAIEIVSQDNIKATYVSFGLSFVLNLKRITETRLKQLEADKSMSEKGLRFRRLGP